MQKKKKCLPRDSLNERRALVQKQHLQFNLHHRMKKQLFQCSDGNMRDGTFWKYRVHDVGAENNYQNLYFTCLFLCFFTMCCMEEGRGAVMLLLARVKRSQSDGEVHQLPSLIHPPLRPTLTHQVKHGHESERKGQSEWCVHRMCVCV